MDVYLKRIKLASFFAFVVCLLCVLVSKGTRHEMLFGFLLPIPSFVTIFFPISWIPLARGLALGQGFAFGAVSGFGVLLGLPDLGTQLFLLILVFLSHIILFICAARGALIDGVYVESNNSRVLASAVITLIYLGAIVMLSS